MHANSITDLNNQTKLHICRELTPLLDLNKRAIQRSDKVPKKSQMYGLQIATNKRTWYFAVKDEHDREEWIKTIV